MIPNRKIKEMLKSGGKSKNDKRKASRENEK